MLGLSYVRIHSCDVTFSIIIHLLYVQGMQETSLFEQFATSCVFFALSIQKHWLYLFNPKTYVGANYSFLSSLSQSIGSISSSSAIYIFLSYPSQSIGPISSIPKHTRCCYLILQTFLVKYLLHNQAFSVNNDRTFQVIKDIIDYSCNSHNLCFCFTTPPLFIACNYNH